MVLALAGFVALRAGTGDAWIEAGGVPSLAVGGPYAHSTVPISGSIDEHDRGSGAVDGACRAPRRSKPRRHPDPVIELARATEGAPPPRQAPVLRRHHRDTASARTRGSRGPDAPSARSAERRARRRAWRGTARRPAAPRP